jgi:predicted GNAT superfamily acetyltransferase
MTSHRDIIDRWPSVREFAADIGITYNSANLMRHRHSINARYWDRVVEAAKARGLRGINHKLLSSTYRSRPMGKAEARAYA